MRGYFAVETDTDLANIQVPNIEIVKVDKGSILPSVDHLHVLSRLLKVHMEDLLVPQHVHSSFIEIHTDYIADFGRLYEYGKRLCLMKSA